MRSLIGQSLTLLGLQEARPVYRTSRGRQGAEMAFSLIWRTVTRANAAGGGLNASALVSRANATTSYGRRPKSGACWRADRRRPFRDPARIARRSSLRHSCRRPDFVVPVVGRAGDADFASLAPLRLVSRWRC